MPEEPPIRPGGSRGPRGERKPDREPPGPPQVDRAVAERQKRWLIGLSIFVAVLLVLIAVLFGYRTGQSGETASSSTTTAPTTPAPSTTAPTTVAPSTTAPNDPSTTTTLPAEQAGCEGVGLENESIRGDVEEAQAFVEETRGLSFKGPVNVKVCSKDSFEAMIAAQVELERAAIEAEGARLKALGLIPEDL